MAEIKFYANILNASSTEIAHTLGSGLGFYGAGFGIAVPVGSQQSTTFVTNSLGVEAGAQLNNTSMISSGTLSTKGTVSINGGVAKNLDLLPNHLCPLNVRFTHTTPVKVQNCKLRIFDRNDISKAASGVTTYVYEARHPSSDQGITSLNFRGNKDNTTSAGFRWTKFDSLTGAGKELILTNSPGMSGLNTDTGDTNQTLGYTSQSGIQHLSNRHDWYLAISSEPEAIGSKTNYGLYFTVEYL